MWSEAVHDSSGVFAEALDKTLAPAPQLPTRVRVQARQLYVFSEALRQGWAPDRSQFLVERGARILAGPALREDGLPGRLIDPASGRLSDSAYSLYDSAFAIFGLSHAGQALGSGSAMGGQALAAAHALLERLEAVRAAPGALGFIEREPAPDGRLQNPHMHLLEAVIALSQGDSDASDARRSRLRESAKELVALAEKFAADPRAPGLIAERLSPGLSPCEAEPALEPGHQAEWVWLLARHAELSGEALHPLAQSLGAYLTEFARRGGPLPLAATPSGEPLNATARPWSQCEALKAWLVLYRLTGDSEAAEHAAAYFDVLMDVFLTDKGGWNEWLEADQAFRDAPMPASTGYHIVCAFSELLRETEL